MISTEEYHRLKRRDREVRGIEDFSEAEAVRLTQPSAESASYDDELAP